MFDPFMSVKETSSRICSILSHPACSRAGVIYLVQISRSDRFFLFIIRVKSVCSKPFLSYGPQPDLSISIILIVLPGGNSPIPGTDDKLVKAGPLTAIVQKPWAKFLSQEIASNERQALQKHERTGRPLGSPGFWSDWRSR